MQQYERTVNLIQYSAKLKATAVLVAVAAETPFNGVVLIKWLFLLLSQTYRVRNIFMPGYARFKCLSVRVTQCFNCVPISTSRSGIQPLCSLPPVKDCYVFLASSPACMQSTCVQSVFQLPSLLYPYLFLRII